MAPSRQARIALFALTCLIPLVFFWSKGTTDYRYWTRWIDNIATYGVQTGYRLSDSDYPPLGGIVLATIASTSARMGIETFVGTSGRVFPAEMKAAPLLRAWLHRLRTQGLQLHMRHRWLGWAEGADPLELRFSTPAGEQQCRADALVLALGGASWPRLGSDGAWAPWLAQRGVPVAPLQPIAPITLPLAISGTPPCEPIMPSSVS